MTNRPPQTTSSSTGNSCRVSLSAADPHGMNRERAASISAIIPALNAVASLPATIEAVAGQVAEIILVDGGSTDGTSARAAELGARVLSTERGRGRQLGAGAASATSPWLLFLHADTIPTPGWATAARAFIADPANHQRAGYFQFALDDDAPAARRLERWVARRCRWLALPYGDQGLLVSRDLYDRIGGYRALPLMEDVDIIRRLGRRRLVALDAAFVTSAARWREEGWTRRSLRNLGCLAMWFLGVPPAIIARFYRGRSRG